MCYQLYQITTASQVFDKFTVIIKSEIIIKIKLFVNYIYIIIFKIIKML